MGWLSVAGAGVSGGFAAFSGFGAIRKGLSKVSARARRTASKVKRASGCGNCFVAGTKVALAEGEQAIETLRVGQRVLTYRCGEDQHESIERDIPWQVDPATWKQIELVLNEGAERQIDITLLRPDSWLELNGVTEGGTVALHLPELGAKGPATVLTIAACPEVEQGDDATTRVITATFKHHFGYPHDLKLSGIDEPIGVTLNHLIWSEDRSGWVQVKDLAPGERVKLHDKITEVESLTPRQEPEPVYNIEVDADHVYRVTDSGLLVHNASCNILADSNVFLDTPGTPFGVNARAIFDDIIADSRFRIFLVKGVATKEILPTPSQLSRLNNAKASIQRIRSANVAPLKRADPLIDFGNFGPQDLKLIQTAVKRGLPVISSNRRMINQIESGASALRRQLYGRGQVQILVPGQHFLSVDDLISILT